MPGLLPVALRVAVLVRAGCSRRAAAELCGTLARLQRVPGAGGEEAVAGGEEAAAPLLPPRRLKTIIKIAINVYNQTKPFIDNTTWWLTWKAECMADLRRAGGGGRSGQAGRNLGSRAGCRNGCGGAGRPGKQGSRGGVQASPSLASSACRSSGPAPPPNTEGGKAGAWFIPAPPSTSTSPPELATSPSYQYIWAVRPQQWQEGCGVDCGGPPPLTGSAAAQLLTLCSVASCRRTVMKQPDCLPPVSNNCRLGSQYPVVVVPPPPVARHRHWSPAARHPARHPARTFSTPHHCPVSPPSAEILFNTFLSKY